MRKEIQPDGDGHQAKVYEDHCHKCGELYDMAEFEAQSCTRCEDDKQTCSGHECVMRRTGSRCVVCKSKKSKPLK